MEYIPLFIGALVFWIAYCYRDYVVEYLRAVLDVISPPDTAPTPAAASFTMYPPRPKKKFYAGNWVDEEGAARLFKRQGRNLVRTT